MTIKKDYTLQIKSILDMCEVRIPVINNAEPLVSTEEKDFSIENIEHKYINIETMTLSIPLSNELKQLYRMISSQDKEYVINDWAIMSLNDVCNNYEIMKEYTNNQIVDFAILYIGMGHYYMCAYDSKTFSYFLRRAGGSNSYDREINFSFFCNYIAQLEKHFDFQYLLDIFKGINSIYSSDFKIVNN